MYTGLESHLGLQIVSRRPLGDRDGLRIEQVTSSDGQHLVVKSGERRHGFQVEARMLTRLNDEGVPVPKVLLATDAFLAMTWIESTNDLNSDAQEQLGAIVARLHSVARPYFGYEEDTPIAGLYQPNTPTPNWLPFFAEHRLIHMSRTAMELGHLDAAVVRRIETLAGKLDQWLHEPDHPALIHGDLWGGNVLATRGRIAALIDPALYYAHPEVELAFGTMFGTLAPEFFRVYQELRPIKDGFFEERRTLYNLYPLLVHAALYGCPYTQQVETVLQRYGV